MVAAALRAVLSEVARRMGAGSLAPWPEGRALGTEAPFEMPPAVYDPAQLDRVTAAGFGRSVAEECANVAAPTWPGRPPVMVTFDDAVCYGGRIYAGGRSYHAGPERPAPHLVRPLVRHDTAIATNSLAGLRYFGHWLRDDCTAREVPLAESGTILSLKRPDWPDAAFYERALGQDWPDTPAFAARRLIMVSDIGFGTDKAARLRRLRARMAAALPGTPNAGGAVYIRRGASGVRRGLLNEDALVAALAAAGVTIVEAETDARAIATALRGARLLVSVEGSQLAHGVFTLADDAALLVLQPPDRFYNPHREWTGLLGLRYGFVVGETAEGGFTVRPDEVLSLADRLA